MRTESFGRRTAQAELDRRRQAMTAFDHRRAYGVEPILQGDADRPVEHALVAQRATPASVRRGRGGRRAEGRDSAGVRRELRFYGARKGVAAVAGRRLGRPLHHGAADGEPSIKYTERLAEAGIEPSVGSAGDSYDNALAETINGLYQAEVIRPGGLWRSFKAVEFATLEWVDWLNNRRPWSPSATSRRPKPRSTTTLD